MWDKAKRNSNNNNKFNSNSIDCVKIKNINCWLQSKT